MSLYWSICSHSTNIWGISGCLSNCIWKWNNNSKLWHFKCLKTIYTTFYINWTSMWCVTTSKLHIMMNCLPTSCWNIFWLNTSRNFLDAKLHNIRNGYNLVFYEEFSIQCSTFCLSNTWAESVVFYFQINLTLKALNLCKIWTNPAVNIDTAAGRCISATDRGD